MKSLMLGAVVAAGLALTPSSASAQSAGPTPPDQDAFYAQRPNAPAVPAGTVLDSRPVDLQGVTRSAYSSAYQLAYRTNDHNDKPITAITTVIVPASPASSPRLLSYQTYEDSLTTNCAPSFTMRGGSNGGSFPTSGTINEEQGWMGDALQKGWTVVVPDYEGPNSEQAIGPLEARTTLDSIRAAERFAPAKLDGIRTPVGIMGYSGGAIPSIWSNAFLATYAPELNVAGVASGGIPADVLALFPAFEGSAFSGAGIGLLVSVQRAYPELKTDLIFNAAGKTLADQDDTDANGCGGSIVNAPYQTVDQWSVYPNIQAFVSEPRIKAAFAHLRLVGGPAPSAPAYFWNAVGDELATIGPVQQLFATQCGQGAKIDFHIEPGGEHVSGMAQYVQPALDYLAARFDGQTPPNGCPAVPERATSPAPAPEHATAPAPAWAGDAPAAPRRLSVRRGRVSIEVACAVRSARCPGSVTIMSGGRTLGHRSFSLRPSGSRLVAVRLTRAAMKRLPARRAMPVLVAISTHQKGRRAVEEGYVASLVRKRV